MVDNDSTVVNYETRGQWIPQEAILQTKYIVLDWSSENPPSVREDSIDEDRSDRQRNNEDDRVSNRMMEEVRPMDLSCVTSECWKQALGAIED